MKETDVARSAVRYFTDMKWDVYQEVVWTQGGNRADIVAVRDGIVAVAEVKTSFGVALLEQCLAWKGFAHFVWAVIPDLRSSMASRLCKDYGIGLLKVDVARESDYYPQRWARVSIDPRFDRRAMTKHLSGALCDGHKTYAEAGNAEGKFWSPFKETCANILKIVQQKPGCTMKEMIAELDHHYTCDATARTSLAKWAYTGHIPGVRIEKDGRFIKWYPKEVTA